MKKTESMSERIHKRVVEEQDNRLNMYKPEERKTQIPKAREKKAWEGHVKTG